VPRLPHHPALSVLAYLLFDQPLHSLHHRRLVQRPVLIVVALYIIASNVSRRVPQSTKEQRRCVCVCKDLVASVLYSAALDARAQKYDRDGGVIEKS
jgi:hypothetical protein